jgi:hypothetical protein
LENTVTGSTPVSVRVKVSSAEPEIFTLLVVARAACTVKRSSSTVDEPSVVLTAADAEAGNRIGADRATVAVRDALMNSLRISAA